MVAGYKQAVKITRTRKSYRTYCFHFIQITDKKLAVSFQKWAIFNIYQVLLSSICETPWMQIFVFLQPVTSVTSKRPFLFQIISAPMGLNRKTRKNMKIWALMTLTGKKHHQLKLQHLQKVQIWVFGLFVQQINSL